MSYSRQRRRILSPATRLQGIAPPPAPVGPIDPRLLMSSGLRDTMRAEEDAYNQRDRDQAYAAEQQAKEQERAAKAAEAEQKKAAAQSQKMSAFAKTREYEAAGINSERDALGNVVAKKDPMTGKTDFREIKAPVQYGPDGKPFQMKRGDDGKMMQDFPDAKAKIGENPNDPTDTAVYRKNTLNPWERINPEDGILSQEPEVKAASVQRLMQQESDTLNKEERMLLAELGKPEYQSLDSAEAKQSVLDAQSRKSVGKHTPEDEKMLTLAGDLAAKRARKVEINLQQAGLIGKKPDDYANERLAKLDPNTVQAKRADLMKQKSAGLDAIRAKLDEEEAALATDYEAFIPKTQGFRADQEADIRTQMGQFRLRKQMIEAKRASYNQSAEEYNKWGQQINQQATQSQKVRAEEPLEAAVANVPETKKPDPQEAKDLQGPPAPRSWAEAVKQDRADIADLAADPSLSETVAVRKKWQAIREDLAPTAQLTEDQSQMIQDTRLEEHKEVQAAMEKDSQNAQAAKTKAAEAYRIATTPGIEDAQYMGEDGTTAMVPSPTGVGFTSQAKLDNDAQAAEHRKANFLDEFSEQPANFSPWGELTVNPSLFFRDDGYKAAVAGAAGPSRAKENAMAALPALQQGLAAPVFEAYLTAAGTADSFKESLKKTADQNKWTGMADAAKWTPEQKVQAVKDFMASPDYSANWNQVALGASAGADAIQQQYYGMKAYAGIDQAGSQKAGEEEMRQQELQGAARQLGGGSQALGTVTQGAMSLIPSLGIGAAATIGTAGLGAGPAVAGTAGVIGSAVGAGMQSAGSTMIEATKEIAAQENAGRETPQAISGAGLWKARGIATVSGAITGLLTRYMPGGTEAIFGHAAKGAVNMTAARPTLAKAMGAVLKGAGIEGVKEMPEEMLDEAGQIALKEVTYKPGMTAEQFASAMIETGLVALALGTSVNVANTSVRAAGDRLNAEKIIKQTNAQMDAGRVMASLYTPAVVTETLVGTALEEKTPEAIEQLTAMDARIVDGQAELAKATTKAAKLYSTRQLAQVYAERVKAVQALKGEVQAANLSAAMEEIDAAQAPEGAPQMEMATLPTPEETAFNNDKLRAKALVAIATGAADSLNNSDLALVDLQRDDAGQIIPAKGKTDSPDGIPRVTVENGQPIIGQATIDRMTSLFPKTEPLIGKTEGERRAEILAKVAADEAAKAAPKAEKDTKADVSTQGKPQPVNGKTVEPAPIETKNDAKPAAGMQTFAVEIEGQEDPVMIDAANAEEATDLAIAAFGKLVYGAKAIGPAPTAAPAVAEDSSGAAPKGQEEAPKMIPGYFLVEIEGVDFPLRVGAFNEAEVVAIAKAAYPNQAIGKITTLYSPKPDTKADAPVTEESPTVAPAKSDAKAAKSDASKEYSEPPPLQDGPEKAANEVRRAATMARGFKWNGEDWVHPDYPGKTIFSEDVPAAKASEAKAMLAKIRQTPQESVPAEEPKAKMPSVGDWVQVPNKSITYKAGQPQVTTGKLRGQVKSIKEDGRIEVKLTDNGYRILRADELLSVEPVPKTETAKPAIPKTGQKLEQAAPETTSLQEVRLKHGGSRSGKSVLPPKFDTVGNVIGVIDSIVARVGLDETEIGKGKFYDGKWTEYPYVVVKPTGQPVRTFRFTSVAQAESFYDWINDVADTAPDVNKPAKPIQEQAAPDITPAGITKALAATLKGKPSKERVKQLIAVGKALSQEIERWKGAFPGGIKTAKWTGGGGVQVVSEVNTLELDFAALAATSAKLEGKSEKWIELAIQEEVIHSVALQLVKEGKLDIMGIWGSLPAATKQAVLAAYPLSSDDLNQAHEFFRLYMQDRMKRARGEAGDDVFTESTFPAKTNQKILDALKVLLDYFRDMAATLRKQGASKETITRVEEAGDLIEAGVRALDAQAEPVVSQKAPEVSDNAGSGEPVGEKPVTHLDPEALADGFEFVKRPGEKMLYVQGKDKTQLWMVNEQKNGKLTKSPDEIFQRIQKESIQAVFDGLRMDIADSHPESVASTKNLARKRLAKPSIYSVNAKAADSYNLTIPAGYTKQGDHYVYEPNNEASIQQKPGMGSELPEPRGLQVLPEQPPAQAPEAGDESAPSTDSDGTGSSPVVEKLLSDLASDGVAYDGGIRYSVQSAGDNTFRLEKTESGIRTTLSYGHTSIEAANAAFRSLIKDGTLGANVEARSETGGGGETPGTVVSDGQQGDGNPVGGIRGPGAPSVGNGSDYAGGLPPRPVIRRSGLTKAGPDVKGQEGAANTGSRIATLRLLNSATNAYPDEDFNAIDPAQIDEVRDYMIAIQRPTSVVEQEAPPVPQNEEPKSSEPSLPSVSKAAWAEAEKFGVVIVPQVNGIFDKYQAFTVYAANKPEKTTVSNSANQKELLSYIRGAAETAGNAKYDDRNRFVPTINEWVQSERKRLQGEVNQRLGITPIAAPAPAPEAETPAALVTPPPIESRPVDAVFQKILSFKGVTDLGNGAFQIPAKFWKPAIRSKLEVPRDQQSLRYRVSAKGEMSGNFGTADSKDAIIYDESVRGARRPAAPETPVPAVLAKEEAKSPAQQQIKPPAQEFGPAMKKFLLEQVAKALKATKTAKNQEHTDAIVAADPRLLEVDAVMKKFASNPNKYSLLWAAERMQELTPLTVSKSWFDGANESQPPGFKPFTIKLKDWDGDPVEERMAQVVFRRMPKITIDVPGDGTFEIIDSKEALQSFLKMAMKFPVSLGKSQTPDTNPPVDADPPSVRAIGKKKAPSDIAKAISAVLSDDPNRRVLSVVFSNGEEMVASNGLSIFVVKANGDGTTAEPAFYSEKGDLVKKPEGGNYPNYKQILPNPAGQTQLSLPWDTEQAIRTLRQALAVMDTRSSASLSIGINPDQSLGLFVSDAETGDYAHNWTNETVPLSAFNPKILLDGAEGMRVLGHAQVYLRMDSKDPVISPLSMVSPDKTAVFVLMPMRVDYANGYDANRKASAAAANKAAAALANQGKPASFPAAARPLSVTVPEPTKAPEQATLAEFIQSYLAMSKGDQGRIDFNLRVKKLAPTQAEMESALNTVNPRKNDQGQIISGTPEAYVFNEMREQLEYMRRKGIGTEGKSAAVPEKSTPAPETVADETLVIDGLTSMRRFIGLLQNGEVTADEVKAAWESYKANQTQIVKDLSKMTMKELERYQGMRKPDNKADAVRMAGEALEGGFNPTDMLQYGGIIGTGINFKDSRRAAMDKAVAQWTDEAIQKQATERRDAIAARQKALTDPETKAEWEAYVYRAGRKALTESEVKAILANRSSGGRQDAVMAKGESVLTPEQLTAYDAVRGIDRKKQQEQDAARKATVRAVYTNTESDIIETKHTKTGEDLFVVRLADRVEKDVYTSLLGAAKRLGGWYSSFRGTGAVPGFQFKSRETAEQFQQVSRGESVDRSEAVQEKREEGQKAAAARLVKMADTMDTRADTILNADRKTNTVKRAREAGYAEAGANTLKAMAKTMRNLAEAIDSGEATHLDGVRTKTHVETLVSLTNRAKSDSERKAGLSYMETERLKGENPTAEQMADAKYPAPWFSKGDILGLVAKGEAMAGAKLIAARVAKIQMNEQDGEAVRLTRADDIANVKELIEKLGDKTFAWKFEDYDRVQAMGLPDIPSLRAALREFLQYRGTKAKADPLKVMERDLVGKNLPGFFPTPPAIISRMLDEVGDLSGKRVLEPSAGKGDIAEAARDAGAEVDAIEMQSILRDILAAKGMNVVANDIMDYIPRTGEKAAENAVYDVVMMNPPFENGQDMDHVQTAYVALKPGGKLVAVMSEGAFNRSGRKSVVFQEWLEGLGGTSEKLPDGSFKSAFRSTGVATRLVVVEKPAASTALQSQSPRDLLDAANVSMDEIDARAETANWEYDGARTIGDPTRAGGAGTGVESDMNDVMLATSDIYAEALPDMPKQKLAELDAEARGIMEADPEANLTRLILSGMRKEPGNAIDVRMRQMLKEWLARQPATPERREQAVALAMGDHLAKRTASQILGASRDMWITKAERFRAFMFDHIYTPPPAVRKQMENASTMAEREAILKKDQERLQRIIDALAKMGVTVEDVLDGGRKLVARREEMNRTTLKDMDAKKAAAALDAMDGTMSFKDIAAKHGITVEQAKAAKAEAMAKVMAELRKRREMAQRAQGIISSQSPAADPWVEMDFERLATMPDAEAEAEMARIMKELGWFPDAQQGKRRTTKRRVPKARVHRPRASRGAPEPVEQPELETEIISVFHGMDIGNQVDVIRMKQIVDTAEVRGLDIFREIYINFLLSGPVTQATNFIGNVGFGTYNLLGVRFAASAVNLMTGNSLKDSASFGEFVHIFKAAMPALLRGAKMAKMAWGAEHDFFESVAMGDAVGMGGDGLENFGGRKAVAGIKGRIIRMPGRSLMAADSGLKTLFGTMEVAAHAYRLTRKEGHAPGTKEFESSMNRLMYVAGSPAWDAAVKQAELNAFQQPLDSTKNGLDWFPQWIMKASQSDNIYAKLFGTAFFPFVKTPYNIAKTAVVNSPLGTAYLIHQVYKGGLAAFKSGNTKRSVEDEKIKAAAEAVVFREGKTGAEMVDERMADGWVLQQVNRSGAPRYAFVKDNARINLSPNSRNTKPIVEYAQLRMREMSASKGGMLKFAGEPEFVSTVARQILAWAAFFALKAISEGDEDDDRKNFLITGSPPKSRGEADLQKRALGGAYRVKLGPYIDFNYGRLEPFATVLASTVDVLRSVKRGDASQQVVTSLVTSLAYQAQNKTFLTGLASIGDILEGRTYGQTTDEMIQRKILSSIVPNLIRQPMRNWADTEMDTKDQPWWHAAFPLPSAVGTKLDPVTGESKLRSGNTLTRMIVPSTAVPQKELSLADKVLLEWNRTHQNPDKDGGDESDGKAYAPQLPDRKMKLPNGQDIELNAFGFEKLVSVRAAIVKQSLSGLPLKPDQASIDRIRKAYADAGRLARQRVGMLPSASLGTVKK